MPKASKDWSCREGLSGGSCDLGRGAPALPDVAPPGERDLSLGSPLISCLSCLNSIRRKVLGSRGDMAHSG